MGGMASLHDWLVGAAWECSSPGALTAAYGQALNAAGVPVWRVQVGLRTLHPLLVAENHTWRADGDGVEVAYTTRETVSSDAFLRSPLAPLYEGAGAIRCRLAGEHAALDYPVLHDLAAAGATDYAALPMSFSDGQLNAVTFATRNVRGFTTEALGRISASVGLLGRLFEVHILRATACTLLDTYLGQRSGRRVLEGSIRRGDGEEIEAAVWFADLRGSTAMAERLPRGLYLDALNTFFDATAGSVADRGGEVLKFIGDAVLAIFPVEGSRPDACMRALAAARGALARLDGLNEYRDPEWPELRAALALHLGAVSFGNIGTADRLDFTAIGPAVNETARLAEACKQAGRPLLASHAFAAALPDSFAPLDRFRLRGVAEAMQVFVPV